MVLRILTNDNYIDIHPTNVNVHTLMQAIDEGNTIALDTVEGNVFVLNTMNTIGIIVSKENEIPPIQA